MNPEAQLAARALLANVLQRIDTALEDVQFGIRAPNSLRWALDEAPRRETGALLANIEGQRRAQWLGESAQRLRDDAPALANAFDRGSGVIGVLTENLNCKKGKACGAAFIAAWKQCSKTDAPDAAPKEKKKPEPQKPVDTPPAPNAYEDGPAIRAKLVPLHEESERVGLKRLKGIGVSNRAKERLARATTRGNAKSIEHARKADQKAQRELDAADSAYEQARAAYIDKAADIVSIPQSDRGSISVSPLSTNGITIDEKQINEDISKGLNKMERIVDKSLYKDIHFYVGMTPDSPDHAGYSFDTSVRLTPSGMKSMGTTLVVHEFSHPIETDEMYQKNVDFLRKRAAESGFAKEDLNGVECYKDSWAEKGGRLYSGRLPYTHTKATEILTTGMERMADDPVRFAREDPEFFDHIWSIIRPRKP